MDGSTRASNVPYGGFKAAIWPVAFTEDFVTMSGSPDKVLVKEDYIHFYGPGLELFACWGGTYPGSIGADFDNHLAPQTSALNAIDFLQGFTDASAKNGGKSPSFVTLLAAIKTAGLADTLVTGGPHVLFAPTDQAFAALPKDKLDAIMADPKSLADLVRNHIAEGYYPPGTLSDRTVTNMLGAKFQTRGGEQFSINGEDVGPGGDYSMLTNGSRVYWITKVLLPAAK